MSWGVHPAGKLTNHQRRRPAAQHCMTKCASCYHHHVQSSGILWLVTSVTGLKGTCIHTGMTLFRACHKRQSGLSVNNKGGSHTPAQAVVYAGPVWPRSRQLGSIGPKRCKLGNECPEVVGDWHEMSCAPLQVIYEDGTAHGTFDRGEAVVVQPAHQRHDTAVCEHCPG